MEIKNYTKGRLCAELLRIAGQEPTVQFLCIGTDRVMGDTLGPLVGHYLTKLRNFPHAVYGTVTDTVHAKNIEAVWSQVKYNGYTVAIDAAVAKPERVGLIKVKPAPLEPGTGTGKVLPHVGQASIVGLTITEGIWNKTGLGPVVNMAEYIASEISLFSKKKTKPVLRQIAILR